MHWPVRGIRSSTDDLPGEVRGAVKTLIACYSLAGSTQWAAGPVENRRAAMEIGSSSCYNINAYFLRIAAA